MLPWSNKTGSSSGPSSIQRDENLANSNQYRVSENSIAESSRFRTTPSTASFSQHDQAFDTFTDASQQQQQRQQRNHGAPFQSSSQFSLQQQQQYQSLLLPPPPPPASLMDGAAVQSFLDSHGYADAVYGEDLHQGSFAYRSYQHQHDHEHSVAELGQQQQHHRDWTELLAAEDIVAYLQTIKYTDDIYGAPPVVEALIREAQQEIAESGENRTKGAVARLAMVRDHLMGHAHGQVEAAARQAQQLQESDWENIFGKSTSL